ncbi:MAG: 3-methyl-2-oxobutanoate hydroxymethyltransferase [Oligoflexia bacterium]|nr:3-methyl-2-oxobutanoate hydroxymethyltransferase [Oligoflexia bacterium]MBF0365947.1 3-methyl-2-oxobutanoate hydroxymethyltransferase [Oligoflexia bacterium]
MEKKTKLNTRVLRSWKNQGRQLQMLTCYDFQTAELLDEISNLDLILVGDSLGNVILGYETTVEVSLEEMIIFSAAVKRGATNTFVVADMPFASYSTIVSGIRSATQLFQKSKVEAVKLEGAEEYKCKLIKRLTEIGIPVMGHIGLTPQSVHEQGGYYIHGKSEREGQALVAAAKSLEDAGAFAVVLECVTAELAHEITTSISIPTIGIGSGDRVDGQVLVINDLLKLGRATPPKFCTPVADLYSERKEHIQRYLDAQEKERQLEAHTHDYLHH